MPGLVTTFKIIPFSTKLLALVLFPSGKLSYLPARNSTQLFSTISFRSGKWGLLKGLRLAHYSFIHNAEPFRKISNLEVRPKQGVQYVRSAGSAAKIVKLDYSKHVALVRLPSGVRKFFSFYSTLILGPCALKLKRKVRCTKSGI